MTFDEFASLVKTYGYGNMEVRLYNEATDTEKKLTDDDVSFHKVVRKNFANEEFICLNFNPADFA